MTPLPALPPPLPLPPCLRRECVNCDRWDVAQRNIGLGWCSLDQSRQWSNDGCDSFKWRADLLAEEE